MAAANSTEATTQAPAYSDWAGEVSYRLSHVMFQARAARALLREHPSAEEDQGLTGVSYLLTRLADECELLAADVSNTEFRYERKSGAEVHSLPTSRG